MSRRGETTMYTVTYREFDTTTLEEHDAIQALETEGVALEEIIEHCQAYHITAALYDAQGSYKGSVHADGNYQLR